MSNFRQEYHSSIGIHIVHAAPWPRYAIIGSDDTYWTGTGWTTDRSEAILYADIDEFRRDLFSLRRQEEQS